MHDMYRGNNKPASRDGAVRAPAPQRQSRRPAGRGRPAEAARAVQEALDRRDNGGDTAAGRDR